ncbi:MAG: DHH family phosphoesterase [Syntrophomonadaceae bacterium]|nr:DHH family phosphoesterase [Syntrophomonadaceae bacterium]
MKRRRQRNEPMNSWEQIAREIKQKDNYLLVGHSIPDGDCVGSLIGLYLGLLSLGKKVQMLLQDPVPSIYGYLAGCDAIRSVRELQEPFDNVIFLDCSDEERVGDQAANILAGRKFAVNIDHHLSNTAFGNLNYVDGQSSSTAELVYELLCHLKVEITPDMAHALYIGIVQDTGCFQHNSTTGSTFRTAAALMDIGINLDLVKLNLFESKSKAEVQLLCLALQSINFSSNGKIAWMVLNYEAVKAIGAQDICPEGIINHTLTVKGVEVGLLFREISPGLIKVGFRSKGEVDVAAIAAEFGGGGHRRAAGAKREGTMEEAERQVIMAVESVVN